MIRLLNKLSRSTEANVFYICAISLLPILGMVGSGVDIGRAYMAKNRLQNACDAGVLAARKTQTKSDITQDSRAIEIGEEYFDHNFTDGSFGVATDANTFSIARGTGGSSVDGQASIEIDTAIMQVFGFDSFELDVECSADIDAQNTDVMLVLDVTISMNSYLGGDRKIDALKASVEDFYEIVQSGYVPGRNRIRYGVVPYAGTVNVGQILIDEDPSWVVGADSTLDTEYTYHTRTWNGSGYDVGHKSIDVEEYVASIDPFNPAPKLPGAEPIVDTSVPSNANGNGFGNTTMTLPETARWEGCIEERKTEHITASTLWLPSGAVDLEIDSEPTDDIDTRWKPYWYAVSRRTNGDPPRHAHNCPDPARKLQEYLSWDDGASNAIGPYIEGLKLALATNQNTGLMWGARLLSPTGLFGDENADAPNGQPISRNLVFMTDGRLWHHPQNYDAYGMHEADGRMVPKSSGKRVIDKAGYARMEFVCDAIKAQGITIWTVEFENDTTVSDSLVNCATSEDHAFPASNAEELNKAFSSIAQQIGGLRLTQ